MKEEVYINGLRLEVYDYREESVVNEPTGNDVRKITFATNVIGDEKRKIITDNIKDSFEIKISNDCVFKAKTESSSWKYTGNILDDTTPIIYSIEILELDKDLPEEHNALLSVVETSIMNWIRTRSISELLIEKGIISEQEYIEKINKVIERDFDNLKNVIAYGKPEPEENIE